MSQQTSLHGTQFRGSPKRTIHGLLKGVWFITGDLPLEIGPVSAAMMIAEMPELGRTTAGEAAAVTGFAPVPRDSGRMRGKLIIIAIARGPTKIANASLKTATQWRTSPIAQTQLLKS